MDDTERVVNHSEVNVDYEGLKLGTDYKRMSARAGQSNSPSGETVDFKAAEETWQKIYNGSDAGRLIRQLEEREDLKVTKYVAASNQRSWYEIEVSPASERADDQAQGFVIRLDPRNGHLLEVEEDGLLRPTIWSDVEIVNLRNKVVTHTGRGEIKEITNRRNKRADQIAAQISSMKDADLLNLVVGKQLTLEEKQDVNNLDVQLAAIALVIRQMVSQGNLHRHYSEERWFGMVSNQNYYASKFELDMIEDLVAKEFDKVLIKHGAGQIFENGSYDLVDTQGEVLRVVNAGGFFAVQIMKRELVRDERGRMSFVTRDYPELDQGTLLGVSERGLFSSNRATRGSQDDRLYEAQGYNFSLNRSLYLLGFPTQASVAAAIEEIQYKLGKRDHREDYLLFHHDNDGRILVIDRSGSQEIFSWSDFLHSFKRRQSEEPRWTSLSQIRRLQFPPDVETSTLAPADFFNRSTIEVLVAEPEELPLRARDVPKNILVQKIDRDS